MSSISIGSSHINEQTKQYWQQESRKYEPTLLGLSTQKGEKFHGIANVFVLRWKGVYFKPTKWWWMGVWWGCWILAGNVANMSPTWWNNMAKLVILGQHAHFWGHKNDPDTTLLCRNLPTITAIISKYQKYIHMHVTSCYVNHEPQPLSYQTTHTPRAGPPATMVAKTAPIVAGRSP